MIAQICMDIAGLLGLSDDAHRAAMRFMRVALKRGWKLGSKDVWGQVGAVFAHIFVLSPKRIAKITEVSEKTIKRRLAELRALGLH